MAQAGDPPRRFLQANLALFVGVLFLGGVLFLLAPKDRISEDEKRELARFPQISPQALIEGQVARGIDAYYSDNFIFRQALTRFAADLRAARGVAQDGMRLYAEPKGGAAIARAGGPPAGDVDTSVQIAPSPSLLDEPGGPPSSASGQGESAPGAAMTMARVPQPPAGAPSAPAQVSPGASEAPAAVPQPEPRRAEAGDPGSEAAPVAPREVSSEAGPTRTASAPLGDAYHSVNSIIVYRNRAVQLFGGSERAVAGFAGVVNLYQATLGPQVAVYCMVLPIGSDFYLPPRVSRGQAREKTNIDQLYARLDPAVRPVRAYEALARRVDDYIYFRTDHHWTGLGAYHAYTAFAQAAGFAPLPLEALTRREIPGFLGSMYQQTLDRDLRANPDTVEYFKVPNRLSAQAYPASGGRGVPGVTYVEQARAGNAYGVFLGADHALFRISSDVGNGRRILVIKDSYGNALAPYLAAHYEEVFVIDYRYFTGRIPVLIREHGINEVVFAHNSFVVNAGFTVARARAMLQGERPSPAPGSPAEPARSAP